MIGLLFLGFLTILICSSWLLIRKIASLDTRWQIRIAALPVCLLLLVPVQIFSGYSLASPWGPLVIDIAACGAYVILMFLIWHKSRIASVVGLAVPFVFLVPNFLGWLIVLAMTLTNASTVPNAEGRISPVASYRIVQYPGIWGGATTPYALEIYKNPRGLPFVWKELSRDTIPCGHGSDANGVLISAGANDYTVVVSCRMPEPGFIANQISID